MAKIGEWSPAVSMKYRRDNLKLNNTFINERPFIPSYDIDRKEKININHLLSYEYSRIWKMEHDEFLKKRKENTSSKYDLKKKEITKKNENKPELDSNNKKQQKEMKTKFIKPKLVFCSKCPCTKGKI